MLEDSISSSPSKSNKSIRETRLKRKIKRKQSENNEHNKSDLQPPVDLHSFINDFYLDSEDEFTDNSKNNITFSVAKTTAIVSNYKPFELEKTLAIADRLSAQQFQRNQTSFMPPTQGFISCINLTQMESEKGPSGSLNQRNSSFSITESEMINCCHLAEQNLQLTPKKDEMFLVNSILEDFSQSPLSKHANKQQSPCQHTPEFRLRRKPIKTYSRTFLNRTKTNLNERFVVVEEQIPASSDEDEDDGQRSASSLSIQEDITMGEVANKQTNVTSLHNTRLCENLLNLSVYFTQNQSQENINLANLSDDQENHLFCCNVAYLLKDIKTLRSIYQNTENLDSFDSEDDFLGFPCAEKVTTAVNGNIDVDSTDHNSIHTTLNITQDLSVHNNGQLDISLNGEDWNDEDSHDIFACINTEHILDQQNCQQSNAVENSDGFVLPQSQPIHNKNTKIPDEIPINKMGFTTASSKPIKVSREAHIMAAKILSKLPDIPSLENEENVENCDNKSLKDNNIFENLDDEWNDDCDLLLNLQTPVPTNEKLKTKTQDFKKEVASTSKKAALGFQTAGGKKVAISRKAQDSVQNLLKEYNTDLGDLHKCEEALKDMKSKVYAKTHNIETKETCSRDSKKEVTGVKNIEETPGSSKVLAVAFRTADGNHDAISRRTQESVENLLKEFDFDVENNYNCEEPLQEMKTKGHNLETKDLKFTSNINSIGFKTAAGKNVKISRKAQESVKRLLKEFPNEVEDNYNFEENLKEIKNKIYAKIHHLETNPVDDNESESKVKNEKLKTETKYQQLDFEGPSTSKMASLGFKTARGKNVNISKKAQESVQKLLKEFSNDLGDNFDCEEDLKELKTKVYNKTHKLNAKVTGNEMYVKSKEGNRVKDKLDALLLPEIGILDFQTAKNSKIVTSIKAEESVSNLFKEFVDDSKKDHINNLELVKNKINERNNEFSKKLLEKNYHNEDLSGIMLSEWPLEKSAETKEPSTKETILGHSNINGNPPNNELLNKDFQTANGQKVTISTKAQQMVQKLLQDFNTDINMENYENDLINMKTKIQNKNEQLKTKSSQEHNELVLSSNDLTPKPIKGKRKYSIDNSELTSPHLTNSSPPAKVQNTGNNNSRSSLVEHSLKSPLTLASHSVILRRNLSLTKKRKIKRYALQTTDELAQINNEQTKLHQDIATPIKSCIQPKINHETPATPNLKEFFSEAALTSTPRLNQATTAAAQVIEETDFKPINWKTNESVSNKSTNMHTTKLSETSTMNISFNSSNPTAKERIGRLKIYGKAPPVSPILIETHHNCRPSGLRRTRSMHKKSEK